jgi:hypothetical protein
LPEDIGIQVWETVDDSDVWALDAQAVAGVDWTQQHSPVHRVGIDAASRRIGLRHE